MAHEITREDSLVLAGRPAWHGLGTVVAGAPSLTEALSIAGLNWHVRRRRLLLGADSELPPEGLTLGADREVDERLALQRSDTGRVLEVVSNDYEVLQNRELAELVREVVRENSDIRVESAGSLKQGRRVFILAHTGDFKAGGSDEVRNYMLFSNTHDGSGALGIIPTTIRVVCANTLRAAESGFRIRHSSNMQERIAQAREALRMARTKGDSLKAQVQRLASVRMDMGDVRTFFLKVYEATHGIIPARPKTDAELRSQEKATLTVAEWVANLDSARNSGTGTEGTVWHALNAATEWSDHKRTVRKSGDSERAARTASNLFGTSEAFKSKAFSIALQVAQ